MLFLLIVDLEEWIKYKDILLSFLIHIHFFLNDQFFFYDYYSFVHFTENDKRVWTWKLTSFSDDDTKNFIRLIIERIPDVALDRIWRMSNNNPLFIIHFIEYLLELNLVEFRLLKILIHLMYCL